MMVMMIDSFGATIMVDGVIQDDSVFSSAGYFAAIVEESTMPNIAFDGGSMSAFSSPYTGSTMATDVHVGSRVDSSAYFRGKIAGLFISDMRLCPVTVAAMLEADDLMLSSCLLCPRGSGQKVRTERSWTGALSTTRG